MSNAVSCLQAYFLTQLWDHVRCWHVIRCIHCFNPLFEVIEAANVARLSARLHQGESEEY